MSDIDETKPELKEIKSEAVLCKKCKKFYGTELSDSLCSMCFKENKTTCNNQENISEVKEEPKVESMAMTECTSVQACFKMNNHKSTLTCVGSVRKSSVSTGSLANV